MPAPGNELRVVEWRGTLGTYAQAAAMQGAAVWMSAAPKGPSPSSALWPLCAAETHGYQEQGVYDVVLAALTCDGGEEMRRPRASDGMVRSGPQTHHLHVRSCWKRKKQTFLLLFKRLIFIVVK